jgi:hypothetical protein
VVATVDVIATDFGRIKCMPSRWMPSDVSFILDADYLAVAFYRNFKTEPLAKTGDADTRMLLCEWGVEMRNPLGHILLNGIKQGTIITRMVTQQEVDAARTPHADLKDGVIKK